MRNDEYDELNDLPSLRAEPLALTPTPAAYGPAPRRQTGLWLVIVLLVAALAALAYWSQQRLELMAQQLVATQDSFAHISEQAQGRIQAISGQVVAAETAVTSESEQLKLKLKQFEQQLAEAQRQQRVQAENLERLAEIGRSQSNTSEQLQTLLKSQRTDLDALANKLAQTQTGLENGLKQLAELGRVQQAQQADKDKLGEFGRELKAFKTELLGVQSQQADQSRLSALEQDLMVIKAQLENTPTAQGASLSEFDAYRAQVTRQLTTLNSQIANLQEQLNAR